MKFSVNLFDEVCFELSLAQQVDGQWFVRGVFPKFLERRGDPHLSLFFGDVFDLHFTANHGRRDVVRRKLVRVGAETAKRFADGATNAMIRNQAAALLPADLAKLTADGWTAHLAPWEAFARWLSPVSKPGATLRVDERAIASIVCSVCRNWVRPNALASLDGWLAYPLLRWPEDEDEADVCLLCHYPQGIWVPDENGTPVSMAEPGWYVNDLKRVREAELGMQGKLDGVGKKLEKLLGRFPRSSTRNGASPPRFASLLFGVYASQLLELSLALAVQKAEARVAERVAETAPL